MFEAGRPPAMMKSPPAYRAGPVPSSNTVSASTTWLIPLLSADHRVPSHLAIWFAAAPPALVNSPPAYKAGPVPSSNTVSANTLVLNNTPLIPLPSADHRVPSHLATWLAVTPPAL